MPNRVKGEIGVTVDEGRLAGDYTLLLGFNALCSLEEDFPDIMKGKFDISGVRDIRRVFHVALEDHHPDLTERDAGSIIGAIGAEAASEKIGEALSAAFPDVKGGGAPRPRKAPAKAGAGTAP